MTEDSTLECDVLVIGAGMAGLTAGAVAAEAGATVIVVEAAPDVGGSAVLSSGYLWTLPTIEDFRTVVPSGDPRLQQVVVDEFENVVEWVKSTGVEVGPRIPVLHGVGNQIDIVSYARRCRSLVQSGGGEVVVSARVEHLDIADGIVVGARIADPSTTVTIRAPHTLIATGGFAQDPASRRTLIDVTAEDMRVRCNPCSRGEGLRLAVEAGGTATGPAGFYGHLVGLDVDLSNPERWDNYTLLHSRAAVLLERSGRRFTDESLGDNVSAEATQLRAGGRGLLVWDDAVHREVLLVSWPPGYATIDKFDIALQTGGHGQKCNDFESLAAWASANGFDGAAVVESLRTFNAELAAGDSAGRFAVEQPPFYALLVEPAITFPYAGVTADDSARVLDSSGVPVGGLLAAGVDVGGVFGGGYGGGLALASTFGLRAMLTAGYVRR